jgi:2-polyprenyl-3-methyl-5-hydroxy-6-metoxy-1,4-benzoquinol methylase
MNSSGRRMNQPNDSLRSSNKSEIRKPPTMDTNYENKSSQYFDGARLDFLDLLPHNPAARILEIGCGFGGTGKLALAKGKCGTYIGIEISRKAAERARENITRVYIDNVETMALPFEVGSFDALIISEVLEHLTDPWATLARLAPLLRDGAVVLASSPNISHYGVIRSLIRGEWTLTDVGVMDRTHLRWFTPESYRQMFEGAGFKVVSTQAVTPESARTRFVNVLTRNKFRHLFMRQIMIHGVKQTR